MVCRPPFPGPSLSVVASPPRVVVALPIPSLSWSSPPPVATSQPPHEQGLAAVVGVGQGAAVVVIDGLINFLLVK